ncbi:MAG TPA: Fic family protein [Thermoleophilaceae bacterium]|nr:Fic family protein [Thermoleophilaceae bacterium]
MILPFDSQGFGALTAELDLWAKRLDERILPHRWEGRLRRSLEAEAVAASTSMEGVPVTVDDALKILAGDAPGSVSPKDQALVLGYRDAMRYVQRRADDGSLLWNRELIVGVQDRVAAGELAMGAGRLRTGATWITNNSSGQTVFEPPQPEAIPDLVDEIGRTMETEVWHPAVAAAWVHVATAAVHPFLDGNGRTARVLASLTMYRGGFLHPAFTNLEEWWGRYPGDYYKAFDCLGSRFDSDVDVSPFIAAHVEAQLSQVLSLALRQRFEGLLWTTLENLLEDSGLPARLANALYDGFHGRNVTSGYYASMIDTSAATARNDLVAATAAGLLEGEGRTRGRHYQRGPRLLERVASMLQVDPSFESIVDELMARADAAMDWPKSTDPATVQESLPGVSPS